MSEDTKHTYNADLYNACTGTRIELACEATDIVLHDVKEPGWNLDYVRSDGLFRKVDVAVGSLISMSPFSLVVQVDRSRAFDMPKICTLFSENFDDSTREDATMSEDNSYDAWFDFDLESGGTYPSGRQLASNCTKPISFEAPKAGRLRVHRRRDGYSWERYCWPGDVRTVSAEGICKPAPFVAPVQQTKCEDCPDTVATATTWRIEGRVVCTPCRAKAKAAARASISNAPNILPGGARLVGKVGERDVYLCGNAGESRRNWPSDATYQEGPWGSQPPEGSQRDLIVNETALADLRERWGFVPLGGTEVRPSYPGLEFVGVYQLVPVYVGNGPTVLKLGCVEWIRGYQPDVWEADLTKGLHGHKWGTSGKSLALTHECLKAMLGWARDGWTDLPWNDGKLCCTPPGYDCPCGNFTITRDECSGCGLRLARPTTSAGKEDGGSEGQAMPEAAATVADSSTSDPAPTYPGFTYSGTVWDGCRVYAGDRSAVDRAPSLSDTFLAFLPTAWTREAFEDRDGLSQEYKAMFCTHEVVAELDTWVDWETRHQFDIVDIRVFAAKEGYRPPEPERTLVGRMDHETLARLGREMPNGGVVHCTERQADELRAMKHGMRVPPETKPSGVPDSSAAPYLGLGEWGQLVDRHPPKAPPPQPILEVADGRVSLHLERLSGDKGEALDQLDRACRNVTAVEGDRGLWEALDGGRKANQRNWPLAPCLRAIEDVHHEFCVAQCKAENEGVSLAELLGRGNKT